MWYDSISQWWEGAPLRQASPPAVARSASSTASDEESTWPMSGLSVVKKKNDLRRGKTFKVLRPQHSKSMPFPHHPWDDFREDSLKQEMAVTRRNSSVRASVGHRSLPRIQFNNNYNGRMKAHAWDDFGLTLSSSSSSSRGGGVRRSRRRRQQRQRQRRHRCVRRH